MKEQELGYLRDELNQRLSFSCEHGHKVLGHILLLWGGTLILFNTKQDNNFMGDIFVLFMMATIFFISVVVLYFLSRRNFGNIKSIFKIASYIAIFYEKSPNIKEDGNFFWELATFEMGKKSEKLDEKHSKFNNEYFILSVIAIFIKVLLLLVFFYKHPKISEYMDILMISICVCYIVISFILSFKISKNLTLDSRFLNVKKDYLKSFLEHAMITGRYTEKDAKERFGEDFYNEMTTGSTVMLPLSTFIDITSNRRNVP
jgi:predicted membrane channel-forming protein YqfA (hemolysin III family)